MESGAWTNERLDDLSRRVDSGFERVDRQFEELRADMRQGFDRVDRDVRELRAEMGGLRTTTIRVGGGIMATLVGVIAAILASGG